MGSFKLPISILIAVLMSNGVIAQALNCPPKTQEQKDDDAKVVAGITTYSQLARVAISNILNCHDNDKVQAVIDSQNHPLELALFNKFGVLDTDGDYKAQSIKKYHEIMNGSDDEAKARVNAAKDHVVKLRELNKKPGADLIMPNDREFTMVDAINCELDPNGEIYKNACSRGLKSIQTAEQAQEPQGPSSEELKKRLRERFKKLKSSIHQDKSPIAWARTQDSSIFDNDRNKVRMLERIDSNTSNSTDPKSTR